MASTTREELEQVINRLLLNFSFGIKSKQVDAVYNVMKNKDTLCLFPTGFGKSLLYQLLPAVCTELKIVPSPVVIIISPLVSLIEDQVISSNSMPSSLGLSASKLDVKYFKEICEGKFNLLFGTPESWLNNTKWREMLSSRLFIQNLVCLVVDEVHKVSWYVLFCYLCY